MPSHKSLPIRTHPRAAGRPGGAAGPAVCCTLGGAAWAFGLYRLLVDPGPARLAEQLRFLRGWMMLFSEQLGSLGAGLIAAGACVLGTVLLVQGALRWRAVRGAGRRDPSPGVPAPISTASS
jgi:hypothetical protein